MYNFSIYVHLSFEEQILLHIGFQPKPQNLSNWSRIKLFATIYHIWTLPIAPHPSLTIVSLNSKDNTNLCTFNLFLNSFLMFWLIICMHLFRVHLDVFFFTKTFIFRHDKLSNSKQVLAIVGNSIISICEKGTIAYLQVYLNIYEAWQEWLN